MKHKIFQCFFTRNIYKVYWSGWFRLFGYGLCFEHAHPDHGETFEQRYGKLRVYHVGNIRFWVLKPIYWSAK